MLASHKFAGVDQTHEQIPCLSPIERAVKQRILAMQHGPLQCPFAEVIVERRAHFAQEYRQTFPVAQQIVDRFPNPELGSTSFCANCASNQPCS